MITAATMRPTKIKSQIVTVCRDSRFVRIFILYSFKHDSNSKLFSRLTKVPLITDQELPTFVAIKLHQNSLRKQTCSNLNTKRAREVMDAASKATIHS